MNSETKYKVVFSAYPDVKKIIENEIGWNNIDGYLNAMIRNEFRNVELRNKNESGNKS